MAAASKIGSLHVSLALNSAQFQEGLKQARSRTEKFKAGMATAAKVGAAALAGGMALASRAVLKFAETADETTKTARALGLTTEELSRLQVGADRSGVSVKNLQTAMRTLAVNGADVAAGANNKAAVAFDQLGVSVRRADGTMKSQRELLGDLAEAFKKMPAGIDRTAAAAAIFGTRGAAMINMLKDGEAGLRAFDAEADNLGKTISTKTGVAAEVFNDNIGRLRDRFMGLINNAASNILPWLADLSNQLFNLTSDSRFFENAVKAITVAFKGLVTGGALIMQVFENVRFGISSAAGGIVKIIDGDFQGAFDQLNANADRWWTNTRDRINYVRALWTEAAPDIAGSASETANAVNEYNSAMDSARTKTERTTTATKAAAESLRDLGREAREQAGLQQSDFRIRMVEEADRIKKNLQEVKDKGAEVADALGDGLTNSLMAATRSTEDLKRALLEMAVNVIGGTLKDALTSTLGGGGGGGGGGIFGSIIGGIAGLFGGGGGGGGYATPLPAFRTGGTMAIGGYGGPDSQLAAFRVSPGENVNITKKGQGGGAPGNITVNVQGANGDAAVEEAVRRGVAEGLAAYDDGLPSRLVEIESREF